MVKSMTGYGGAKGEAGGFEFSVEIKSVNNRYLDTGIKLPRGFIFAEEALKAAVAGRISRGKVDVFVSVDSSGAKDLTIKVNEALAQGYIDAVDGLAQRHGIESGVSAVSLLRIPDVFYAERREPDRESVLPPLRRILEEALCEFEDMRAREGEGLRLDLLSRLREVERLLCEIERRSPESLAEYKERLEQKMRELLQDSEIAEARIVAEAAIFADRIAVDEETVRLKSHIAQFREMLDSGSPIGRKLDFLIQEFNREANTIGSKCNDGQISRLVVDLKSEIEKIREQVQNIE